MADVVKALVHLVGTAMVGGSWAGPCTEGAPIVRQDLSGRPAM